jgi:hypothetical protein
LHQQDPLAASGPFLVGLKLTGDIKLDRLIQSIKILYAGDSNLNFAINSIRQVSWSSVISPHSSLRSAHLVVRSESDPASAGAHAD